MGLARTPERQDIRELARLIGRDEMNLAEFPITLLTDRVPDGLKTIEFQAGGREARRLRGATTMDFRPPSMPMSSSASSSSRRFGTTSPTPR